MPAAAKGKGAVSRADIAQLADALVTAHSGGIAGYAAARPAKGRKIDLNPSVVLRYRAYWAGKQHAALRAVVGCKRLDNGGDGFSGIAGELTEAQAQKPAQMPGVLAFTKEPRTRPAR